MICEKYRHAGASNRDNECQRIDQCNQGPDAVGVCGGKLRPIVSDDLSAYYYSFSATGVDGVDMILREVASTGKSYHHTEDWREDAFGCGSSMERIQRVADRLAKQIRNQVPQ